MGPDRKYRLKSCRALLCAALVCCLVNINVLESRAADSPENLELLKQVYSHEDYPAARQLAEEILATQPNNLVVRYYLANSLLKLRLPREALVEYRICYTQGKNSAVGRQSARALAAFSTAGFQKELPDAQDARGRKSKLEALKEELLKKELEEKKSLRRSFDTTINNIQTSRLNTQEERTQQTQAAFDKLAQEEAQIERRYQRQLESLLHRDSQIVNRSSLNHGTTQVAPQGSSIYVQNFEHLGDESEAVTIPSENPLKAKAQSLGQTPLATPNNPPSKPNSQPRRPTGKTK